MLRLFLLLTALLHASLGQENTKDLQNTVDQTPVRSKPSKNVNPEDQKFVDLGIQWTKEYDDLRDTSVWKEVLKDNRTGITVYGVNITEEDGKLTTVLKAEAIVDYPPEAYHVAINSRFLEIPKWNPIILEAKFIRLIAARTKILYQLLKPQAALDLPPRQFVVLFRTSYGRKNGFMGYKNVFHSVDINDDNIPVHSDEKVKRAFAGVNGIEAYRTKKDSKKTVISWIATLDLNYPEIDDALVEIFKRYNMLVYMDSLINHVHELCQTTATGCGTRLRQ